MKYRAPYRRWTPTEGVPTIVERFTEFETVAAAQRRQAERARTLGRGPDAAQLVAHRLENCSGTTSNRTVNTPCDSPACPTCMRQVRQWLATEMMGYMDECHDLAFVTIIPQYGRIGSGELDRFDVRQFVNTTRQRLRRGGLGAMTAIGGVNVTYDEADRAWQFHFHMITTGIDAGVLRQRLQRIFPRTKDIYRPVTVLPVRNRPRQFTYVLKSFWRRKTSFHGHDGQGRWRKYSRELPLKAPELCELLTCLDQYRPQDMIFMRGAKVGAGGKIQIPVVTGFSGGKGVSEDQLHSGRGRKVANVDVGDGNTRSR